MAKTTTSTKRPQESHRSTFDKLKRKYPHTRQSQLVLKASQEWKANSLIENQAKQERSETGSFKGQSAKSVIHSSIGQNDKPLPISDTQERMEQKKPIIRQKIIQKEANSQYLKFYTFYSQKLKNEHPKWSHSQVFSIISLLWKKQKLSTKPKEKSREIARRKRILAGRQAFRLRLTRSNAESTAAQKWKKLPREGKLLWRKLGKQGSINVSDATVKAAPVYTVTVKGSTDGKNQNTEKMCRSIFSVMRKPIKP